MTACKERTIEGSSFTDSGLEYRIVYLGDELRKPESGDYVKLKWVNTDVVSEEVIGYGMTTVEYIPKKDTGVMEALGLLYIGDSAVFRFRGGFGSDTGDVHTGVKPLGIADPREEELEERFPGITALARGRYREYIPYFADSVAHYDYRNMDGVHVFNMRRGSGRSPSAGSEVTLHYEGFLLNGKKFDSTFDRGETFTFVMGDPDQLIKGLEIAVSGGRKGDKSAVLIPPHLAFGNGSSDGTVGPGAPVVYFVEIIEIIENAEV